MKKFIFVLISILVVGFSYEKVREFVDNKNMKPVGEMVEINGHEMHIYGKGVNNNTPTVVFTSGWKTPSPYVDYKPLQDVVSEYTRAVVYERPGYGWSEIDKSERDVDTITNELYDLLHKSNEKGPYILVGHSFGANECIRFAQLYPDEVAGVVLLDGSNPDYTITQKRPSKYFMKYGTLRSGIFNNTINTLNNFGVTRALFDTTDIYKKKLTGYKNSMSLVDKELIEIDEAMFIKHLNNKNHMQELRMESTELVADGYLGDIPLIVMTSSVYQDNDFTKDIQGGLLKWSNNSKQVIVENSQHYIQWYRPDLVSDEIYKLMKN